MKPTTPIIQGLRNRYAARCSRNSTRPWVLLLAQVVFLTPSRACPVSTPYRPSFPLRRGRGGPLDSCSSGPPRRVFFTAHRCFARGCYLKVTPSLGLRPP